MMELEIERIRNMGADELAIFLISYGEEVDTDEDFNGSSYNYSTPCYYTPYGKYPGWWSEDDVIEELIHILLSPPNNKEG